MPEWTLPFLAHRDEEIHGRWVGGSVGQWVGGSVVGGSVGRRVWWVEGVSGLYLFSRIRMKRSMVGVSVCRWVGGSVGR